MNFIKTAYLTLFSCLSSFILLSQEVTDAVALNDISNVSDEFEHAFYEALSNRLIENYDKAIFYIKECIKENDSKPILFFELGKNHFELKEYEKAEVNFEKALQLMPNEEVLLQELQRAYFSQQKYDKTIATLKSLVDINPKYKLTLAKAYLYTQQYGKSLSLLNSYQSLYGYDTSVNNLRNRIYTISKDKSAVIIDLEKALDRNPKNEDAYVKLIEVYKETDRSKEADKVLNRFIENVPESSLLDFIVFQEHLDNGDTEKATALMKKLTSSNNIEDSLKQRVLNDYRTYGKQNPKYKEELRSMDASTLNKGDNSKFFMELSSFQLEEGSTESLLQVYESNLDIDPNNYDLIKDTLLLQLYYGKNEKALTLAKTAIDKYPSQPLLYLLNGVLLAKSNDHTKAISSFTDGLDYIVDNPQLERALYLKIADSHEANGAVEKAKKFRTKGEQITGN